MSRFAARWRLNDLGEAEAKCKNCLEWFPVTKEFWYFQRGGGRGGGVIGVLAPQSWCKCCYRILCGRGPGMRRKGVTYIAPARNAIAALNGTEPEVSAAQAGFLTIPAGARLPGGAVLGLFLEAA